MSQHSQILSLLQSPSLSPLLSHLHTLIRTQLHPSTNPELKNLSQIETLSYFLRTHAFKFKQLLEDSHLRDKVYQDKQYTQYLEKLERMVREGEKGEAKGGYASGNLRQQWAMMKVAGISFGENNWYYLEKVIANLARKNNVKEIRFWGKILGRKDYYVVQGISSNPYLNQLSKDGEGYGIGVNSYSYWVSNDILGDWIQLPLVTPTQVKSSREFKYIFSGNPQAKVEGFVPFNGLQKHLLKCIIARITHACYLAPKGLYKMSQTDPNLLQFEQSEQGFKLPQVNQLLALESWVHLPASILPSGRTSHYIDPSLPQQQKQALRIQLQQKQPIEPRLKSIAEDKPYDYNGFTSPTNWISQLCGQSIPVAQIGKQEGQNAVYGVALLRNLGWPGSATVGYRGGWTSVYCGYGHRASQEFKIVKELADLQIQGNDVDEKSQPNPAKLPVEKAPQAAQEPAPQAQQ